jgi:hypothetical protein
MVKSFVPVIRHADYEVQYRTLPVSQKSSFGKPLIDFSDDQRQIPNARYDAERFLHGKVREYLLRSAAHSEAVQIQQRRAENPAFRNQTFEESVSGPSHYDIARQLNGQLSDASLKSLPKQLRAFVIAQILKDARFDVQGFSDRQSELRSLSHEQLKSRLFLRRVLISLGASIDVSTASSSSKVCSDFNSACHVVQEHSDFAWKVAPAGNLRAKETVALMVSCLIVSGSIYLSETHSRSTAFGIRIGGSKSDSQKQRLVEKLDSKWTTCSGHSSMKKESGFGTAPIWYQQSMENGPP